MKAWKTVCGAMLLGSLGLGGSALADGRDSGRDQPDEDYGQVWEYLLEKYDANDDGLITREEYGGDDLHWKRLDKDGNGKLEKAEGGVGVKFKSKKARKRIVEAPKPGSFAPKFELEIVTDVSEIVSKEENDQNDPKKNEKDPKVSDSDEKRAKTKIRKKPKTVSLKSFRGEKSVALIFGSYT